MTTADAAPKCQHCGFQGRHPGVCPTIKAIEYHPDGSVKRVEYKVASDYSVPMATGPSIYPPSQPVWPFTSTTWGGNHEPRTS